MPLGIQKAACLAQDKRRSFIEGRRETLCAQSGQLLLILIWAHFTTAIFLALEDSLLTLIIEVGRSHGLHVGVSFPEIWLWLPVDGIIAQSWRFDIQLVVKIFGWSGQAKGCRRPASLRCKRSAGQRQNRPDVDCAPVCLLFNDWDPDLILRVLRVWI